MDHLTPKYIKIYTAKLILNRFLPTRQARVRRNSLSPWFDAECRSLRLEPAAWRGGIGSQNHKWIALPGSNPSLTCTNVIVGRKGTTGRLKLQRMLTNRSGYGPLSTPYLVGGELTARKVFHPSRQTNT